jgi:hypothetical protein
VYEGDSTFALNDVIEVVGFLSVTPTLCVFSDEMEEDEMNLDSPPASLVPRLHAVYVRKLQHNNPLWQAAVCNSGICWHHVYFMHLLHRVFLMFLYHGDKC